MIVRERPKYRFFVAVGLVLILALLALIALSGGNLQLIKSLIKADLSNEELSDQLKEIGTADFFVIFICLTVDRYTNRDHSHAQISSLLRGKERCGIGNDFHRYSFIKLYLILNIQICQMLFI